MSYQSDLIATDIEAYLKQHENKEILRFLTCGNVDDGKSTLIGRLLHDSKMIYEDQLEAVTKDSVKSGTTGEAVDLALLVDGLQAEREQGITIDVAYRYFSTTKRKFIIADTPGHEQYTRNMATGASNCQLAIILIDARYGVQTQTRRHSFIATLLGIKHIVVAINKMDLMDYSEQVYNDIRKDYSEFARELEMEDVHFVPLSALAGDNVVNRSEHMPWYHGETLMDLLENVEISSDANLEDMRFPVQYVNRPNLDFRGYCGTLASGILKPGDDITVLPSGKESRVKALVTYEGNIEEAIPGEAITVTLEDEIDVSRGDMIVHRDRQPHVASQFKAMVVWMAEQPLVSGKQYSFKVGVSDSAGVLTAIDHQIDINTLAENKASELRLNEIGLCEFSLSKPVVFDGYKRNRSTGAFIVIDRLTNVTIGAGMITEAVIGAKKQAINSTQFSEFEVELNALIRKHFPHWDAKDLSEFIK
ncbi:MAG: sulfate adenylyltransferase subunit CysN [Gammaproteobacteria bacterium]|nr:sulfate adenylyltransferase subunit CysN [Gammaproteobacteria bacterium]